MKLPENTDHPAQLCGDLLRRLSTVSYRNNHKLPQIYARFKYQCSLTLPSAAANGPEYNITASECQILLQNIELKL